MRKVTSMGFFNDAVGKRMSITFSEIDQETGQITADNKRIDRVITDEDAVGHVEALEKYAQRFVNAAE